jgi:hypothetical protein
VMFEVGVALASRQSSEVLLIRDDKDPFLFDVSVVPHMQVDFTDTARARDEIASELGSRLKEIDLLRDARVHLTLASMTSQEQALLRAFRKYTPHQSFYFTKSEGFGAMSALPRLLDKRLIKTVATTKAGRSVFAWTKLGYSIACDLDRLVPTVPDDSADELKPADADVPPENGGQY